VQVQLKTPHQLVGQESVVSSPSGVWGTAPATKRFCQYLNAPYSFSCNSISIWVDTLLICVTTVPVKHT